MSYSDYSHSFNIPLAVALISLVPHVAPKLPEAVESYFQHTIVKIVTVALIAILLGGNVVVSIGVSAAVVLIFEHWHKLFGGSEEGVDNTLLIRPQCRHVTAQQILDAFSGENFTHMALDDSVRRNLNIIAANTSDPHKRYRELVNQYNLSTYELNDYWAPYVASQLTGFGFSFDEFCHGDVAIDQPATIIDETVLNSYKPMTSAYAQQLDSIPGFDEHED